MLMNAAEMYSGIVRIQMVVSGRLSPRVFRIENKEFMEFGSGSLEPSLIMVGI
jgi:hypothetical protein